MPLFLLVDAFFGPHSQCLEGNLSRDSSGARSASLATRITDRLRRAILDAEFGLGEALSEDKLSASFGCSRTPVRDSLTGLQIEGLIDIKPQRGSFVFMPNANDVAQLCEIRSILEVAALRLSVVRNKETTLARLRKATDDMEVAKAAGDFLSVSHADTEFHLALVESSDNKYLIEAFRLASGRVVAIRSHVLLAVGDIRTRSMQEHRAIIEAIESGNLAQAESTLAVHISMALEAFNMAREAGFLTLQQGRRDSAIDVSLDDA